MDPHRKENRIQHWASIIGSLAALVTAIVALKRSKPEPVYIIQPSKMPSNEQISTPLPSASSLNPSPISSSEPTTSAQPSSSPPPLSKNDDFKKTESPLEKTLDSPSPTPLSSPSSN